MSKKPAGYAVLLCRLGNRGLTCGFRRSTLSHDFYQVFAGKSDMTLHGWRQLVEWSIEHSCLTEKKAETIVGELAADRRCRLASTNELSKEECMEDWRSLWRSFCEDTVNGIRRRVPEPVKPKGRSTGEIFSGA